MTPEMIPVFKPAIEQGELDAVREALELGWLGMGSYVGDFEKKLESFLGLTDRHAVALSTGHAALHLGLLLAGVGPGDEVITPSFNNAADFQAILATGASPVLCDIHEESLCIDLEKAALLVTERTKAIIVMDYDCVLCDHASVAKFAEKYGVRVLHDAAHSIGSKYQNQMVGSFSDMTMFSFDPVKTVTCIDGGALIVRNEADVERLHGMRLVGMRQPAKVMYTNNRAWTYDIAELGFRYHMSNLHAAIGLAQFAKFDDIEATRRATCLQYNRRLGVLREVIVPKTDFKNIVPFLYYIRVPAEKRDALRQHLRDVGVDTGIHWQPGHHFTLLKEARRGDLSVTDKIAGEILSLPLHSFMAEETIERVITGITSFFND